MLHAWRYHLTGGEGFERGIRNVLPRASLNGDAAHVSSFCVITCHSVDGCCFAIGVICLRYIVGGRSAAGMGTVRKGSGKF